MSTCEKCWARAASAADPAAEYERLIARGPACSPEEQAGPDATLCAKCGHRTAHQRTGECMRQECGVFSGKLPSVAKGAGGALAMTLDEARSNVGAGVVYEAFPGAKLEDGVITSVNERFVFVRYRGYEQSQATEARALEFLAAKRGKAGR